MKVMNYANFNDNICYLLGIIRSQIKCLADFKSFLVCLHKIVVCDTMYIVT